MQLNNKITIVSLLLVVSQAMTAQFYVGLESGVGNIQNNSQKGKVANRLGLGIKAGYIYSLNKHFGLGSGIELSQYRQQLGLENTNSLSNLEVDATTSAFVYTVTTINYSEKQTLTAVQIPLFIQYKKQINKGVDFNFRAGAKYFLPINYKIEATASNVSGTGYYPNDNLTITDEAGLGFGTSPANYSASGSYTTKAVLMSMFEMGFTFDMGKKNSLYLAMNLERGYGSIVKLDNNQSFIGYNPTAVTDRKANGLYSIDKNAKVYPVAFGLTVSYNFK